MRTIQLKIISDEMEKHVIYALSSDFTTDEHMMLTADAPWPRWTEIPLLISNNYPRLSTMHMARVN